MINIDLLIRLTAIARDFHTAGEPATEYTRGQAELICEAAGLSSADYKEDVTAQITAQVPATTPRSCPACGAQPDAPCTYTSGANIHRDPRTGQYVDNVPGQPMLRCHVRRPR